ncbi:MAG: SIMPL domain-containing protein [bacterium]|nr:SIMPL domain-containing protein [bacterium]
MNEMSGVLRSPLVARLAVAFLVAATALVALQALDILANFGAPTIPPQNVITVSGEGKVSATPNLATISFTVSEDAVTAAAAQDAAAKKINAALAVIKNLGIADKDVQTSSYNVYPRYSSPQPCYGGMPCIYNGGEQTIIGYTASQTVTVKVRNIDSVGSVVSAVGEAGISNVYGPNLTIEDPNALQAQARAKAIADARAKAKTLAKDLGVRIIRVVNYSEGGGYPIFYGKGAAVADSAPAPTVPQIPAGENEIIVDVSVTYEIR